MYIEQESDEVIKQQLNLYKKPTYIEEFNFPFAQMDHHIFEILIYYIFTEDIKKNGEFSKVNDVVKFDSVRLMKEGTDEGRDCTLHLAGKAVGVIQCKCYEKDIAKRIRF